MSDGQRPPQRFLAAYASEGWGRWLILAGAVLAARLWWPDQVGHALTAAVAIEVGAVLLALYSRWAEASRRPPPEH